MKKIFTLSIILFTQFFLNAQVMLNEIYCSPSASNHEFFELYNGSSSQTPASLDAYSVVAYFEDGNQQGFYVLDIPNFTIAPRGHFVGSSALPLNYQGITGSTNSDFSWNDAAAMGNNGSLKKWVVGNTDLTDGNLNYDAQPIPANFNDFFYRKGGNGASYNIFLYKDGVLLNSFFGGNGGSSTVPAFIQSMPALSVDMQGGNDYTINFSSYNSLNKIEFVNQDAGSDNGYIRLRDGYCGEWNKSSSNAYHTPKASNGGAQVSSTGVISVANVVVSGSTLNYEVVSAPAYTFPILIQIYVDIGTVAGQLDENDGFIEEQLITSLGGSGYTVNISPANADVIIVVNSGVGCIDKILFTPNSTVLGLKFLSFNTEENNNINLLKWSVNRNEDGKYFEIEESTDGRNYKTFARMNNTSKTGAEHYTIEKRDEESVKYYRIKAVNKNNSIAYSKVIYLNASQSTNPVTLLQNPVVDKLNYTYNSNSSAPVTATVYNINGLKVASKTMMTHKGVNQISMELQQQKGTYILEIISGSNRSIIKFIKQ